MAIVRACSAEEVSKKRIPVFVWRAAAVKFHMSVRVVCGGCGAMRHAQLQSSARPTFSCISLHNYTHPLKRYSRTRLGGWTWGTQEIFHVRQQWIDNIKWSILIGIGIQSVRIGVRFASCAVHLHNTCYWHGWKPVSKQIVSTELVASPEVRTKSGCLYDSQIGTYKNNFCMLVVE